MALYRDEGVVLRTYKLGEADRIVVVLTRGRGKVRAVAKGVRKTTSRFGARLEPTSHVALQLYEGRQLDTVTQVETIDRYPNLRLDFDRFARAESMLEAVDQVAQEREPVRKLHDMLVRALATLDANGESPLVAPAFFWKLLDLEGLRPILDECAVCGATEGLVAFDLDSGGVLCRTCRRGDPLSPEGLELLRAILGGRLAPVLALPPSSATAEVDRLATRALEHHLERRLRSIQVLDHT